MEIEVTIIRGPAETSWYGQGEWAGDERDIPSPRGGLVLRFHSPCEFAMGSSAWRCQVLGGEGGFPVRETDSFLLPDPFQPWGGDGRFLCLPRFQGDGERANKVELFDLHGPDRPPVVLTEDWPLCVACHPTRKRVAIATDKGAQLLDFTGRMLASFAMDGGACVPSSLWWARNGEILLGIASHPNGTEALAFAPDDGRLLARASLDPDLLVPFDRDGHAWIDRNRHSLLDAEFARGAAAVLLDRWASVTFDPITSRLGLEIYRPYGAPVNTDGFGGAFAKRWRVDVALDFVRTATSDRASAALALSDVTKWRVLMIAAAGLGGLYAWFQKDLARFSGLSKGTLGLLFIPLLIVWLLVAFKILQRISGATGEDSRILQPGWWRWLRTVGTRRDERGG